MSNIIDLSQCLTLGMPAWSMSCGFHIQAKKKHDTQGYATHVMDMPMGIGTHVDAPYHFDCQGITIDQLSFASLIAPAVVIHWQPKREDDQFTIQNLQDFERQYGQIAPNTLVLLNSGWSTYWQDTKQYRNVGSDGFMHFPTIHVDVAKCLMERGVVGLGVDTLSPDPENSEFFLHRFWLSQGKIIIENLANLDQLPIHGATVYILPLKIEGAAEAPARVIAVL